MAQVGLTDAEIEALEVDSEALSDDEIDALEGSQRSFGQKFKDAYISGTQSGFPGLVARKYHDWMDTGMEQIRKANPNATPEQLEELQTRLVNATQKQLIADLDAKQAADPIFREDESFIDGLLSPTRWGPYLSWIVTGKH